MSRRQIVIEIDCEDERCGECRVPMSDEENGDYPYCKWSMPMNVPGVKDYVAYRGPECLQAERDLAALIAAVELTLSWLNSPHDSPMKIATILDAAVAKIREGK